MIGELNKYEMTCIIVTKINILQMTKVVKKNCKIKILKSNNVI